MQANVWINDDEDINENGVFDNFPASSGGDLDGIDNDSNGYTDDVIGWNFNNGNNNPQHTTGSHGTHVAGTAAAVTNNSTGIAGVSWNSKIMACRVGDGSSINVSNAVAGIYYAIDNGAKVINMSWSGSGTIPPSLNTAIVTATNNNVTLIASAGNENNSNPRYPASHALVLGVAALNEDDTKHGSSSYGTWIDISAPAFNVFLNYVPGDPNPHQYHSGAATSTASPFVSGLAALVLSVNPSLSDDDARNIILNTPDNVDAANPSYIGLLGAGRINAYQALLLTHAYSNKSVSSTATASNNGRRMVKTSDNRYHLVFESGVASGGNVLSEIFYRRSNSGGTSWETPTRLSAGDEQNRYPSIVERVDGTTKKLYAAWQRKTGTNTYNVLFRHFNGSSWETIQTISSGISLSNDPLPVLAISTPSASFEMMVVYRTNSGLQSRRSTSLNGTSWGSEVLVTSNTSARNPSVTYSSNDYANFDVAWDNGSHIYHRHFYGSNWSSEVNVSSGLSTANTHEYPSYARGSTNNRHIVWQATDQTQGNRKVIFHSYNLNTTTYTKFYSGSVNYLRPNIAGIGSGGAYVLWHDDSGAKNIRYARFNGSYWETSSAGVVYASNGSDASVATMNPAGTSIKGVYRSAGNSPYSLSLGGYLNKPDATEEITYSRQILFGQNEEAAFALRIATPVIDSEAVPLIFPEVAWEDSLTTDAVIDKSTFDFTVPANAGALQFETEVYANNAGQLLQDDKTTLELYFELIDRATNTSLETSSREFVNVNDEIKSTKPVKIALTNHRGVAVRLRPVIAGLDLNKTIGALVHVYGDDGFGRPGTTKPNISAGTNVSRLSISAWPNPFNPATQIHFDLPSAGLVSVRIFDVNGRLVREWREEQRSAGEHVILWDGRDRAGRAVTSGVYLAQIIFGTEYQYTKMTLVR